MNTLIGNKDPSLVQPSPLESAIYTGVVYHKRSIPKIHKFDYKIYLFWLKLSEINRVAEQVKGFSQNKTGWSLVNFSRNDYLGETHLSLEDAVLTKMNDLSNNFLTGEVFMLGQIRTLGLYFSPVNFYYLRNENGLYTHMLAEVSNTPWNKRHCYLVDLQNQESTRKAFHVSPFNPMDMQYKWQIQQPNRNLNLHLSCYQQQKHFEASIVMQRKPLNTKTLRQSIISIPSMTIKTVLGIYWQAIKLFFKRIPIYTNP